MTGSELLFLFEWGYRTVKTNLEGISNEESLRSPAGGGNSLNWVLGHLVSTRQGVLAMAEARPPRHPEIDRVYNGQEWASFEPAVALSLERLTALLDESQEALRTVLPGLTDERMAAQGFLGTVAETLAFLTFHEGYHAGQLGVLRRTLGKPGKIKPPKRPQPTASAR